MGKQNKEEALFTAALAFPAPERERFLGRACADDKALLERVRSLLDARDDAAEFVREADDLYGQAVDPLSRYQVLRELGEGGSGVVYLAEQVEPVKRQVALKVLKPGMDSKAVLARFDIERHALALMDHPNIAKVFDAGTTSTGRPYVAMELVRGIKITEYCDLGRLRVPERLNLFLQVCQAVQHAHYQGIIHRDIKPSNVLVTLHDGVPVAKVIDFSIAKAVQGHLTDHTVHTMIGHFIGTPEYVSPEQVTFGLPIDTRSDLYSLGVLLYELLSGSTPFDLKLLQQGQFGDLNNYILEYEAPRPSRRLSSLPSNELDEIASQRQTSGDKLIQQLRGDLDWIVMRCLEKDRSRRYQTADEIIREIQRHLRHEPVSARPPSIGYSVAKFARRNRLLFAASLTGIAFVVLLFAFAVTTAVQTQRIAAERDRAAEEGAIAEQVSRFMLNVFSAADPYTNHGKETTASELLERAKERVRNDLKQHPEVRARLLNAIGRAYRRMGRASEALSPLEEAVQILKVTPSADATVTLSALTDLAKTWSILGHVLRSEALFREATEFATTHDLTRTSVFASMLVDRGSLELGMSKLTEAQKSFEAGLALYRELAGPRSTRVADVLMRLCLLQQWQDDYQAAERSARVALAIYEASVPRTNPDRLKAQARLGEVLHAQGRLEEANELFAQAVTPTAALFGSDSRQVADLFDSLAKIRQSQGRLDEAESLARRAVAANSADVGIDNYGTAYFRTTLGIILTARKKLAEAEIELRGALETYTRALPPDHQYKAAVENALGELMLQSGRVGEAAEFFAASMARWKRAGAPQWRAARSASGLGEALYRQGRVQEAERYLEESFKTLVSSEYADVHAVEAARERLVRFYAGQGQAGKLQNVLSAAQRRASSPTLGVRAHASAGDARLGKAIH